MSEEQKKDFSTGIEVTAAGVIYNDQGEVLLIRSPKFKNKLTIPGGHINKDESYLEACRREILEETGLEAEDIEPFDFDEGINPDYFHRPVHFIHLHFAVKTKKGEVKLNDEATEFMWIKPEEALKRNDLACRETIESYLRYMECSPAKSQEYLNNWKRALADYDNLKKETAKEREEMGKFAMGMAAMSFLEVFENYKKAMGHQPDLDMTKEIKEIKEITEIEDKVLPKLKEVGQWLEGVGHIKNQFADVLKQMGVEEIKTVGEKFNPAFHEAVGEEKIEGKEAGMIVREVEGGYKMGERTVKAAKVIVSK